MDILGVGLVCHTSELDKLIWLEEKDIPHGSPGHCKVYSYYIMLTCSQGTPTLKV